MAEKSILQQLVSGLRGSKPLTTVEQRCPAGLHLVDPKWTKCPYCDAEKNASERSSPVAPEPVKPLTSASRRATQVDNGQPPGAEVRPMSAAGSSPPGTPGARSHTIVDSLPSSTPSGERHVGGGRRLKGILTTFTWSRLGELYTIRDGRNYAGSGVVSADNNTPCEILVVEDGRMSSAHFLILCSGGRTIVSDNFSTNGTFVNGEQIDTRGIELPDNAVIEAGATVFTFQKILIANAASTPSGGGGGGREDSGGEGVVS